jgi:hypothetical protein
VASSSFGGLNEIKLRKFDKSKKKFKTKGQLKHLNGKVTVILQLRNECIATGHPNRILVWDLKTKSILFTATITSLTRNKLLIKKWTIFIE